MNLNEYLTRRTDEFEPHDSGENGAYHSYFQREYNIALVVLGAAGIMYSGSL